MLPGLESPCQLIASLHLGITSLFSDLSPSAPQIPLKSKHESLLSEVSKTFTASALGRSGVHNMQRLQHLMPKSLVLHKGRNPKKKINTWKASSLFVALGTEGSRVKDGMPATPGHLTQPLDQAGRHRQAGILAGAGSRRRDTPAGVPDPLPFLSSSHMKAKQGRKPMGPHITSSAMSKPEKP